MSVQPDLAATCGELGGLVPIGQARDELDAVLRALGKGHHAAAVLPSVTGVTGCSKHIGKARWRLHLAQGAVTGAGPAP